MTCACIAPLEHILSMIRVFADEHLRRVERLWKTYSIGGTSLQHTKSLQIAFTRAAKTPIFVHLQRMPWYLSMDQKWIRHGFLNSKIKFWQTAQLFHSSEHSLIHSPLGSVCRAPWCSCALAWAAGLNFPSSAMFIATWTSADTVGPKVIFLKACEVVYHHYFQIEIEMRTDFSH